MSAAQRTIRVGVIGAGRFAEQAHIPGLQAHPQARVVALCGRNQERAAAMAERFGIPRVYTDYEELLAQSDIDAVTVATPDDRHMPVALAALAAGKHVFCEKPLAKDATEARRLVAAADGTGLVNMVAFTFRYTRAVQALRRLLREGALGVPFAVQMQVHWGGVGFPGARLTWRESAAESAAGIWADGAAHLFDVLAYILAPVQAVCAQMMVVPREPGTAQPDSIDFATCLARVRLPGSAGGTAVPPAFADRERGTVHVTVHTSRVDTAFGGGDTVQVSGTRATANVTLTRGGRERASLRRAGGGWDDVALPEDAHGDEPAALPRMLGAFVDAVVRGAPDPDQDATFAAGWHAQEVIDAAVRSAQQERWETVMAIGPGGTTGPRSGA